MNMIKKIIVLLLPFIVLGCSEKGAKRIKNIVELTPRLIVESNEPIILSPEAEKLPYRNLLKYSSYKLSNHAIMSPPLFSQGIVYVVDGNGKVIAFSQKEKKILWSSAAASKYQDSYIGGGIAEDTEGKLYITNGSKFLTILNKMNGNEILRKEFPDIIRTQPVILANKIVIIQTVSNQVFAYNLSNSTLLWQHEGISETLASEVRVSPVIYDDYVIIFYSSGQVVALDTKNGQEKWRLELASSLDVSLPSFEPSSASCPPIVEKGYLYLASSTNKLIKIDIASGNIVWQLKLNDIQTMSLYSNSLFITTNARQVAAISTSNGKVKWVAELDRVNLKKRKLKATTFLPPRIVKNGEEMALIVISKDGEIYSFRVEANAQTILRESILIDSVKEIEQQGRTTEDTAYFLLNKHIIFVEEESLKR